MVTAISLRSVHREWCRVSPWRLRFSHRSSSRLMLSCTTCMEPRRSHAYQRMGRAATQEQHKHRFLRYTRQPRGAIRSSTHHISTYGIHVPHLVLEYLDLLVLRHHLRPLTRKLVIRTLHLVQPLYQCLPVHHNTSAPALNIVAGFGGKRSPPHRPWPYVPAPYRSPAARSGYSLHQLLVPEAPAMPLPAPLPSPRTILTQPGSAPTAPYSTPRAARPVSWA